MNLYCIRFRSLKARFLQVKLLNKKCVIISTSLCIVSIPPKWLWWLTSLSVSMTPVLLFWFPFIPTSSSSALFIFSPRVGLCISHSSCHNDQVPVRSDLMEDRCNWARNSAGGRPWGCGRCGDSAAPSRVSGAWWSRPSHLHGLGNRMRMGQKPDRTKIIKDPHQALSYGLSQYCLASESFTPLRPCNGGSQPVDHNFLGGQTTFTEIP